MEKIKIIIVDDVEMTRVGLSILLKKNDRFQVVAEAPNGVQFLSLLETCAGDLVLMDVNMPIMGGIEATREAKKRYPDLKFIALTNDDGEEYIEDMVLAGAKGFLMKKVNAEELQKAIEVVINGGTYLAPELVTYYNKVSMVQKDMRKIALTAGEETVLNLLCKGFSLKEIADKLMVSPNFVDIQCKNLSEKTSTKNAVGLVLYAIKNKMVSI